MNKIFVIVATVLVFVMLIGAYLAPDDLSRCATTPTETPNCRPADVIVAVSGGDTQARTDKAVQLYQAGWAPKLMFSGAAADKSGPSNAAVMRTQALKAGVPEDAIIIEGYSETTHENAQRSGDVVQSQNFKRVILVTSAYHQRRASIEFRHNTPGGVEVVNSPVRRDRQWSPLWWITPTGWWLAGGELVKIVLVYVGAPR